MANSTNFIPLMVHGMFDFTPTGEEYVLNDAAGVGDATEYVLNDAATLILGSEYLLNGND